MLLYTSLFTATTMLSSLALSVELRGVNRILVLTQFISDLIFLKRFHSLGHQLGSFRLIIMSTFATQYMSIIIAASIKIRMTAYGVR